MKRALINGITGQDGAYLAEFLLEKGYEVHAIKRRASLFNTDRIDYGDVAPSGGDSDSKSSGKDPILPGLHQRILRKSTGDTTRGDMPFYPRSPYAAAKLYAYWVTVNYREAYGMYACNGILFNHESPLRGETFVTRKITMAVARIALGLQNSLYLGNLDAKRDWGHARDFVARI